MRGKDIAQRASTFYGTAGILSSAGEVLRIDVPPASVLSAYRTPELEGVPGHTALGCYVAFGDWYICTTFSDGIQQCGPDPGDSVAALAGLTSIVVEYPATNVTAEAAAILWETAINASAFPGTVTRTGAQLDISGDFTAADAFKHSAFEYEIFRCPEVFALTPSCLGQMSNDSANIRVFQ